MALGLPELGVHPGDVVSYELPNWTEFLVLHHAVTRIGVVNNPLIPIYRTARPSNPSPSNEAAASSGRYRRRRRDRRRRPPAAAGPGGRPRQRSDVRVLGEHVRVHDGGHARIPRREGRGPAVLAQRLELVRTASGKIGKVELREMLGGRA